MPNAGSITYWYLQVPNLIIWAVIVLLLFRLVLSLVLDGNSAAMRLVGGITRPVTATVGVLTPQIIPQAGVILCAVVWLMAIRTVLFMVALALGVRL